MDRWYNDPPQDAPEVPPTLADLLAQHQDEIDPGSPESGGDTNPPYPGPWLPPDEANPTADLYAPSREGPGYENKLTGGAGYGVPDRQGFDFPSPDPPPMRWNGGNVAPWTPNKPVLPDWDTMDRFAHDDAPTAGDFLSYATRAFQKQGESNPAMAEGNVPGMHIGSLEDHAVPMVDLPHWAENNGRAVSLWDDLTGGARAATVDTARPLAADALREAAPVVEEAPPARRMYRGTGSDYPSEDPAKFDPNGLYGPGAYYTDAPEVAGSYGETRAAGAPLGWSSTGDAVRTPEELTGANVRPVDLPHDLNLFDAEAPANPADIEHARAALAQLGEKQGVGDELGRRFDGGLNAAADPAAPSNHDVYTALSVTMRAAYPEAHPLEATNKALAAMGYDGVQYQGGRRIPMYDAAGAPIEHTAVAVFPEAIQKVRNALSGRPGGQAEAGLALDAAGATGGGLAGYETAEPQQPGESDEAYAIRLGLRTVGGATAGLGASLMASAEGRAILREMGQRAKSAGVVPGLSIEDASQARAFDDLAGPVRADALAAGAAGPPPHAGIVSDAAGTLRQPSEVPGAGAIPEMPQATLGQRAQAAAQAIPGGVAKYSLGLLGNPASVAAIAIKNALDVLTVQPIAGAISAVASGRPGDVVAQAADALGAIRAAPGRAVEGFRRDPTQVARQFGYEGATPAGNAVTNTMAQFVRTHIAIQNALSQGVGDVVIGRIAREDAALRGLTGDAATQHVQELVDEARALRDIAGNRPFRSDDAAAMVASGDATPVGMDLADRGIRAGQRATYTDELGPFGQLFKNTVKSAGVVGQSVAPFTHIPSNAMAREIQTSPVGILGIIADVARGEYGNLLDRTNLREQLTGTQPGHLAPGVPPLNERLARSIIGAGLTYVGANLAAQGLINVMPSDPKAAALFRQKGEPDGSIKIGGYDMPLTTFGIPGAALKVGAELHQAAAEGRGVPMAAAKIAWDVMQHSPLSGSIELLRAIGEGVHAADSGDASGVVDNPEMQRLLENQAERWVPAGGLLRATANALDPNERQISGPVSAVESMLPGVRNTLPVRTDATNRPTANPRYLAGALNPLASRQETQNPVLRALDQHGVSVASGNPPPTPENGEVPWSPGQQSLYRALVGAAVERKVAAYGDPGRLAMQPTTPKIHDDLTQRVKEAHAEVLKDPRLASTTPELLARLAHKYEAAPPKSRGMVLEENKFALSDYKKWLDAHGDGNLVSPRNIQRYVELRPR